MTQVFKKNKLIFLLLFICCLFSACSEETLPKPKGFFRIDMPEKNYRAFNFSPYPVSFEMPSYVMVEPVEGANNNEKWFNLVFKPFNAKLYISYSPLNNNLAQHIELNHKLTYDHQSMASAIKSNIINYPQNQVFGLQYTLKGKVATPLQFYITDSTSHFLRASLYFELKPNYDSLAPVLDFIKQDVDHFLKTVTWQ